MSLSLSINIYPLSGVVNEKLNRTIHKGQLVPNTDAGTVPNLRFSLSDTNMTLKHGGWSREVTARELPVATTIAGVNMRLTPGGVRELHWHKELEWCFMLAGRARITAVDQNGKNFIADVGVGDLCYFPPGIPHSIQGLAGEGCEFLLLSDNWAFSDLDTFTISDWFAQRNRREYFKCWT